ncbi:MAG: hypothetical protein M1405_02490 [Patescibacteria group bacterium]|nr:hypothetical protein [Patescibacteria group bacterium]
MRRKRPLRLLVLGLLSVAVLIYLVLNFPPTYGFMISDFRFQILPIVLVLVFLFIFSLVAFLLNNKRRGFLVAVFILGYFILKLINLTHPFFIILLLILLAMLELLFAKRK